MKKTLFLLSLLLFITLSATSFTAFASEEYKYKQRSKRMEGLKKVPSRGRGISLLSFVAYREPLSLFDSSVLRIRFFLPQPSEVYITAVELRRHGSSHYQMKPLQTSWNSGWQEFHSWPTKEVLQPLKIPLNEVGIIARLETDRPGSGTIAPIVLYEGEGNYPIESGTYKLHLLPKNTLSRVDYSVIRVTDSKSVISNRLQNLAANVPFVVNFNLSGHESGNYRLLINSKEWGRTRGPSREYLFYHRRQLRD